MMIASERSRKSFTKALQYCSVNLTKLMKADKRMSVRSRSGLNMSLALKSSTRAALAKRVLSEKFKEKLKVLYTNDLTGGIPEDYLSTQRCKGPKRCMLILGGECKDELKHLVIY